MPSIRVGFAYANSLGGIDITTPSKVIPKNFSTQVRNRPSGAKDRLERCQLLELRSLYIYLLRE